MITEVDRAAAEFRKRAETPAEADRLGNEAAVLTVARHPGVVQLLGWDGATLRLRLVDGPRPADLAPLAAAVTTTFSDLHHIGVAHGALRAEHILVDRSGHPVLCGFGHGRGGVRPNGPEAAADGAALAEILRGSTGDPGPRAARARGVRSARPGGRLARSPSEGVRSARKRARLARHLTRGVVAAVALAIAVVTVVVAARGRGAGPAVVACPAVDRGCRPLPRPAGVIALPTGRYRVGRPGDVVVIGRWACRGALPALLEPTTGEIWVWDGWASPGQPQPARRVARVAAAASMVVDPGRSGCDRLRVTRPQGRSVVIVDPGPAHDRLAPWPGLSPA